MKRQMIECGRGGIGRRAGFRYQWRESWGFESLRPHHLIDSYASWRGPLLGQYAGGNCRDELKLGDTNGGKEAPTKAAGLKTRYGHAAISQIGRIAGHGEMKDRCFDECV